MTGHTRVADPLPGRGNPIQLVRYVPTREGWGAELVEGRYVSSTRRTIQIQKGGVVVDLDREQWAVCLDPNTPTEPVPPAQAERWCTAKRTRLADDPAVTEIRPIGTAGAQREGRRLCTRCGANARVTQRLLDGAPAASWSYEQHTIPSPAEATPSR